MVPDGNHVAAANQPGVLRIILTATIVAAVLLAVWLLLADLWHALAVN